MRHLLQVLRCKPLADLWPAARIRVINCLAHHTLAFSIHLSLEHRDEERAG
jgi:hypothetical protein